jgi:hypothetical protein
MSINRDIINLDIRINGASSGKTLNEITAQARQLRREIGLLDPASDQAQKKMQELSKVNQTLSDVRNATRGINTEMTGLKATAGAFVATFVATQLAGFITSLGNTSIELESLDSKFNTVFGEATPLVEEAAQRQAIALGLTQNEYRKAASSIGDLLIPMEFSRQEAASMSTELVGLSGALSAWTGGTKSATEVSDILTKALLGEREQLKTLGVSIQEADVSAVLLEKGQNKLTGTALQQAKALATLELIQGKTTDAQDRFNGSSKTLAQRKAELTAKIRDVYEQLAVALIPTIAKGIDFLSKMVTGFVAFIRILIAIPAFIKENKIQIGLLIVALLTLNTAATASAAATLAKAAAEKAATIATTTFAAAQRVLNFVMNANPIGLVVSAIALLIGGLITAYQKSEKFRAAIDGLSAVVSTFFRLAKEGFTAFSQGFSNILDGNFKQGLQQIGEGFSKFNPLGAEAGARMGAAFNKGFEDSIKKSKADKAAEELLNKNAELRTKGTLPKTDEIIPDGGSTTGKASKAKTEKEAKQKDVTQAPDIFLLSSEILRKEFEKRQKEIEKGLELENQLALASKLQNQTTAQQYDDQVLQSKKDALTKQATLLAEFRQVNTSAYRDIANQILAIDQEITANKVKDLQEASAVELTELQNKFLTNLISEQAYQEQSLAIKRDALVEELKFLEENGLTDTEAYRTKLNAKLQVEKEISDASIKNAKNEADIKRDLQKGAIDVLNAGIDLAIAALSRDEASRKKHGETIKKFEIARILTNLYSEISGYYKTYADKGIAGNIIASALSAIAGGRSLLAISNVRKQQYEQGGLLKGPLHTQGGIPFTIAGQPGFEAEGGEFMINRRSAAAFLPQLMAINSFNGWGKKFEQGGVLPTTSLSPSTTFDTFSSQNVKSNNNIEQKFTQLMDFLSGGLQVKANVVYSELQNASDTVNAIKSASGT